MGFDDRALEDFAALRFDGEVWAVPEGRIVYSEEPLLEVTAPVAMAQVVETLLLNQITLHTTLASKAARYIAGRRRPATGRLRFPSHPWRRSRDGRGACQRPRGVRRHLERRGRPTVRHRGGRHDGAFVHRGLPERGAAFRAFAEDHPGRTTFLVDTYDTLGGVRTAIETVRDLGLDGTLAVRLDSGDLDALSRDARALLDDAGLRHARIFASGGLDEHEVHELVQAGAPVDAFGIGTQIGVAADAPYIDSVYKLVEYDGRPR